VFFCYLIAEKFTNLFVRLSTWYTPVRFVLQTGGRRDLNAKLFYLSLAHLKGHPLAGGMENIKSPLDFHTYGRAFKSGVYCQ
jgi:hypothetical protein